MVGAGERDTRCSAGVGCGWGCRLLGWQEGQEAAMAKKLCSIVVTFVNKQIKSKSTYKLDLLALNNYRGLDLEVLAAVET